MLGVSTGRLRAYVKAGLLSPERDEDGELRFSFQDLLLLRTAEGLVSDRLPPRRVRNALVSLRERLPRERPLTGVQLGSLGQHVVVRDDGRAWQADSGQVLFPFSVESGQEPVGRDTTGVVANFERPRKATPAGTPAPEEGLFFGPDGQAVAPTAEDLYQLGCNLEEMAPEAARVAYQKALSIDPNLVEAHINLGRLMHDSGDLPFAEEHYRAALVFRPDDATARFNLGVVLEDRGRLDAALEMYEATVRSVPNHADAHFNAARLYDRQGQYEAALRHLRAYKSLTEA